MKKRRLFLLLTLFMVGLSLPQQTQAVQKETAVSIKFQESIDSSIPLTPSPKDQVPKTGGTQLLTYREPAQKLLPKTGEVLTFSGRLIGTYMVGLFLLILLVRRKAKEEDYE